MFCKMQTACHVSKIISTRCTVQGKNDRWQNRNRHKAYSSLFATAVVEYGGFCTCCGINHFLQPTPQVLDAARKVKNRLDAERRIDFDCPTADPLLHTDYVHTKGPGRMFGVLVCQRTSDSDVGEDQATDENGLVVLKAFSGQMSNYWHIPGWVGPVPTVTNLTPVYQEYRSLTEALSTKLASLDFALLHHEHHQHLGRHHIDRSRRHNGISLSSAGISSDEGTAAAAAFLQRQRLLLRSRRRALSHELLNRIQDSYRVRNWAGHELRLLDVYDKATRRHQEEQQQQEDEVLPSDGNRYRQTKGQTGKETRGRRRQHQQQTLQLDVSGEMRCREQQQKYGQGQAALPVAAAEVVVAFPAGTGDCCAPKLLWAAVQKGLLPLGMVEFWYGSPPNTATAQGRRRDGKGRETETRTHGEMYGMCEKCEAILGTMLCGVPAAVERKHW